MCPAYIATGVRQYARLVQWADSFRCNLIARVALSAVAVRHAAIGLAVERGASDAVAVAYHATLSAAVAEGFPFFRRHVEILASHTYAVLIYLAVPAPASQMPSGTPSTESVPRTLRALL